MPENSRASARRGDPPGAILVVEDDPKTVKLLRLALEPEGYRVTVVENGLTALDVAPRERPSLIILDRRLPGLDGFEVCRRLRALSDVPILMLTAAADEVDRIVGLSIGADDYVTKPFSPREVVARVQAILRRVTRPSRDAVLRRADLEMDLDRHVVSVRGAEVQLTPGEFLLLRTFLQSPGRAFSRGELLNCLYPGGEAVAVDRAVDVHVGNLRRKLGDDSEHPSYIATVRGVGYKLL